MTIQEQIKVQLQGNSLVTDVLKAARAYDTESFSKKLRELRESIDTSIIIYPSRVPRFIGKAAFAKVLDPELEPTSYRGAEAGKKGVTLETARKIVHGLEQFEVEKH